MVLRIQSSRLALITTTDHRRTTALRALSRVTRCADTSLCLSKVEPHGGGISTPESLEGNLAYQEDENPLTSIWLDSTDIDPFDYPWAESNS